MSSVNRLICPKCGSDMHWLGTDGITPDGRVFLQSRHIEYLEYGFALNGLNAKEKRKAKRILANFKAKAKTKGIKLYRIRPFQGYQIHR